MGYPYWARTTIFPLDATIQKLTWHSSDEQVATVTSYGLMEVVGEGTATITATAYNGISCSVTVNTAVRWPEHRCEGAPADDQCGVSLRIARLSSLLRIQPTRSYLDFQQHIPSPRWTAAARLRGKAGSAIISAETRQGGKREHLDYSSRGENCRPDAESCTESKPVPTRVQALYRARALHRVQAPAPYRAESEPAPARGRTRVPHRCLPLLPDQQSQTRT